MGQFIGTSLQFIKSARQTGSHIRPAQLLGVLYALA
jgi:hypothetical protein